MNPASFASDIDNYQILPYILVTLMAIIFPWLEVLCAIFLFIPRWRQGASFTLLVLTIIFLVAISSALVRGLDIDCGCFVAPGEWNKIGFARLFEDLILLGIIFIIYRNSIKKALPVRNP